MISSPPGRTYPAIAGASRERRAGGQRWNSIKIKDKSKKTKVNVRFEKMTINKR
jgi:hypothetical protein